MPVLRSHAPDKQDFILVPKYSICFSAELKVKLNRGAASLYLLLGIISMLLPLFLCTGFTLKGFNCPGLMFG